MKQSAGILLYKKNDSEISVLLAHPGGPFWKNKDLGAWSIPKGEFTDQEKPFDAAIREFEEEIGIKLQGNFIQLHPVKIKSGKIIHAWALEKDIDATQIKSNTFEMEWPPKSGKFMSVPEIDKAEWFTIDVAMLKINSGQTGLISELVTIIETYSTDLSSDVA